MKALRCIMFARMTAFELVWGISLGLLTLVGGLWVGFQSLVWMPV